MLYLILTITAKITPIAATIPANNNVYSVPIVLVINPAIAVTLNVAILDDIITILVIFPFDTWNKSDIVDTAICNTLPAALNPTVNPIIINAIPSIKKFAFTFSSTTLSSVFSTLDTPYLSDMYPDTGRAIKRPIPSAEITYNIAAVFISSSLGYDITIVNIITIALLALISSIGTPAAPGSSSIILFSILTGMGYTNGTTIIAYSLILAINRPIDMLITAVNVVGDAATAVVVAKSENILKEYIYYS